MSLITAINDLSSRVATEFNTLRSALPPYDGSTAPTTGQIVEFNGTNFVPADAPVGANPDLISQAEAEAGTATTERTFSALRIAQAIAALGGGGGGGGSIPVAQVRNTNDTQDLNSSGTWTTVPLSGATDTIDSGSYSVSTDGITVLASGTYEVSASIYCFPNNTSRAVFLSFAVNGTTEGPRTVTNRPQNNGAFTSGSLSTILTLSANDDITLQTQKNHGFGPMPMVAGLSVLNVKKLAKN